MSTVALTFRRLRATWLQHVQRTRIRQLAVLSQEVRSEASALLSLAHHLDHEREVLERLAAQQAAARAALAQPGRPMTWGL